VDYQLRLALVALDSGSHGVGIARYEGVEGDDCAEVAVAVSRDWRRVGLGSGLFLLLAQAAIARGIRRFRALYLVENEEVARLLRSSQLPSRSTVSKGVVETELDLVAPPHPSA
ncbi:MAG TPA: GNAT family N-acetyltransferase, partial [Acidimicrobiales bacterium]|nr:GNAT family N-acetyltransferase [Acidimicrobiales bacterium]